MERVIIPQDILIDARNVDEMLPKLMEEFEPSDTNGFDLETFDKAHDALAAYCKSKRKSTRM